MQEAQQLQQDNSNEPTQTLSTTITPIDQNSDWPQELDRGYINGTEPRMFPGCVHERARRGNTRQDSNSENDLGAYMYMGTGGSTNAISKQ